MACPPISTGQQFLSGTLDHIDCQAQALGSLGFQSLAAPGGSAQLVLTALLTIFVALYGLRLLAGNQLRGGDAIVAVLKVGIVLALALSWPAYRTVVYDVVLQGPAEIAAGLGAGGQLPGTGGGLADRLQAADDQIVALTALGTGRGQAPAVQQGGAAAPGDPFAGIALQDQSTFGWARVAFLAGTLAPLAALRLAAGLLLALAPLFAGLLLFEATRGLFAGWLRGLVLTALGSLGVTVVLSAELALVEPWLADALQLRYAMAPTPAAPTELLALTSAFALAALGMLAILARVAFHGGWPAPFFQAAHQAEGRGEVPVSRVEPAQLLAMRAGTSRAHAVAEAISRQDREATGTWDQRVPLLMPVRQDAAPGTSRETGAPAVPLGSAYRRTARRTSAAGRRRDSGQ